MKRSVRPLFSILLLAVFAATLASRSLLRRGFDHLRRPPPPLLFNSTFLAYASVDIGESKAKQQIEELLRGNLTSVGWLRTARLRRRPQTETSSSQFPGVPTIFRSPNLYKYWLKFTSLLRNWSRNKNFDPEVISDLVRLVKQPLNRHGGRRFSDRRYSTCAVVGNSGILVNRNYGDLVDTHEFVIRLNNARINNFESDVGSKTNLSFINSNILHLCGRRRGCFCHPYGPAVPLLVYICQPIHFLDLAVCNSTIKDGTSTRSNKAPILVTDPRFDVLCSRIVKYYSVKRFVAATGRSLEDWPATHEGSLFHYSSGFQAVMLALGICDKVSIFGFGKSDSAKHHYHTNQKAELSLHDYEAEYDFYRDLVENPRLVPFVSDKFMFPPVVVYR